MSQVVQYAIVAVVILVAAAYVVRQGWRTLAGRKGSCSSVCSGCDPSDNGRSPTAKSFVPIESLEDDGDRPAEPVA